jgi:hypothetical protein
MRQLKLTSLVVLILTAAVAASGATAKPRVLRLGVAFQDAPMQTSPGGGTNGRGTNMPGIPGAPDTVAASAPASQPAFPAAKDSQSRAGGLPRSPEGALARLYLCFELVGTASVAAWIIVWIALVVWSFRTPGMPMCLAGSFLVGLVVVYGLMVPHAGEILAVPVWAAIIAAVAVLAAWAWRRHELPFAFATLLLALAAFGLGWWNSDNVSRIREDRSAELAAARQRQIEARLAETKELRERATHVRFAEDDANDAIDAAGYSGQELARLAGKPADANAPPDEPEYRKQGKQKRKAGQLDANASVLSSVAGDDTKDSAPRTRLLPGADYVLANQLDLINRFAIWLTLVTALLMAGVEYLRRFNLTFGSILPLPIAGRAIDAIWSKTHAVLLRQAGATGRPAEAVRDYLDCVVRKGESFILVSSSDPWPGQDKLPRLGLLPGLWPLRKIVQRPGDPACAGPLVFESAWYGRYGFVLLNESLDRPLLAAMEAMLEMLRMRHRTRAAARRTVNLVWDLPAALPAATVEELALLCREVNFKFLAVTREASAWPAEAFDEVHDL